MDCNLSDRAAALTYYGMLSLFPAMITALAVLGLIGHSATQPLIDSIHTYAPGPTRMVVIGAIENLQKNTPTAGAVFVVGLITAVWSASGYLKSYMRAANTINDTKEDRSFWHVGLIQLLLTFAFVIFLSLLALSVAFTGPLAEKVGGGLGVGKQAVEIWNDAKWPVIGLIVLVMFEFLYRISYRGKRYFKWVSPGAFLAVFIWTIVSAGFAIYVSNFAHFNKTYGSLGGVVIFLIWLWLSNTSFLLGVVLNAQLERRGLARKAAVYDRS